MLSAEPPVMLWRITWVPAGEMSVTRRSPIQVCVRLAVTATLAIVWEAATFSVLVTPVALLSGMARFAVVRKERTWLRDAGGLIVRLAVVVRVRPPPVPVIVIDWVPVVAPLVVVTVRVEEPFAAIGFGENE